MIIRGNTIKYSSMKKRKKQEEEKMVEEKISKLEEDINTDLLNIKLEKNTKISAS